MAADLLTHERVFFDNEAAALSEDELLIPTEQDIRRYRNASINWRNMTKDALFASLQPLEGKQVLDYGCGHGENSCILAACGAKVTAFDLSPGSIEQARRRALLHNCADRIQFDVRSAGDTGYLSESFDVVTGFAVLHHLHMMLPKVFAEIHRVLKPGGLAAFIEPAANSPCLRLLRRITPLPCYATPDERQLRYEDFGCMRDLFTDLSVQHFNCFGRLLRITGGKGSRPLIWLDYWGQRVLPIARKYYGTLVVVARKPKLRALSDEP